MNIFITKNVNCRPINKGKPQKLPPNKNASRWRSLPRLHHLCLRPKIVLNQLWHPNRYFVQWCTEPKIYSAYPSKVPLAHAWPHQQFPWFCYSALKHYKCALSALFTQFFQFFPSLHRVWIYLWIMVLFDTFFHPCSCLCLFFSFFLFFKL